MDRSPRWPTVELWILGRISRHPSGANSMPARMLVDPPKYLKTTAAAVAVELTRLSRIEGLIHCTSGRWWMRNAKKARALLKRGVTREPLES
jgi:hypothetical protein